jgi:hypothetical protein
MPSLATPGEDLKRAAGFVNRLLELSQAVAQRAAEAQAL